MSTNVSQPPPGPPTLTPPVAAGVPATQSSAAPLSPPFRYGSGAGMGPPSPATHPGRARPRRSRDRTHSPDRDRGGRWRPPPFQGRSTPVGPQEELDWLSALGNVHDSIQTIERNIRDHAAAIARHDNLITEVTQAVQQTQTAFATQASENASHQTRWTNDMTQHIRTNFATVDVVEQLRLYSVSLEARINSLMQFIQSTGRNEAEAAINQEAAPPCEAQDVTAPTGGTLFNSCLLYTSPSPRDRTRSRIPSSA